MEPDEVGFRILQQRRQPPKPQQSSAQNVTSPAAPDVSLSAPFDNVEDEVREHPQISTEVLPPTLTLVATEISRSMELLNEYGHSSITNDISYNSTDPLPVPSQTPSSMCYVNVQDFGAGDFPDDVNAVLQDYFSVSNSADNNVSCCPEEFCSEGSPRNMFDELQSDLQDYLPLEERPASSTVSSEEQIALTEQPAVQLSKEDLLFLQSDCCASECSKKFNRECVIQARLCAMEDEFTCDDHVNHNHLRIIGQIIALMDTEEDVTRKNVVKDRSRATIKYMFRGQKVCRAFFLFVNYCGRGRLENLIQQVRNSNLSGKTHGNTGRTPKNVMNKETLEEFSQFMNNFANTHGLILPGRMPYHKVGNRDLKLLPSSMTKNYLHSLYSSGAANAMPYSSFTYYWREMFPNIVIQSPRTDLCSQCHANTISLQTQRNLSEEARLELLQKSMLHLKKVTEERKLYQSLTVRIENPPALKISQPLSFKGMMHYSFDFAQQVCLPHDAQQVGALYFLAPYKVALFGVACEPIGKFVLYIIPESVSSAGKGSNMVVSLLHHFFENFGVGEEDLYCHADNCTGQNKNNYLMQYLTWRTIKKLNSTAKISFLPVGHTKFAPDLFFGIVKRRYRHACVHSLEDLVNDISTHCGSSITPCMVANEKGDVAVKLYDWQKYFRPIASKIAGIKDYYHFETSKESQGAIVCRKEIGSEAENFQIFASDHPFLMEQLPETISITGLSFERQKYLYDKIREFVSDDKKDILCPQPIMEVESNELANSNLENPEPTTSTTMIPDPSDQVSLKDKARKCGYCGDRGHQNRILKNSVFACPKRRQDSSHSNDQQQLN